MKKSFWALLPLFVFILVYLGGSWYVGDFYKFSVLGVFMLSLFVAFIQFPKTPFSDKLSAFSKGAGDETILLMILIFLLAGAFSEISKAMGAVDAVVSVALYYIPSSVLIAGFFLIAAFISISIGTSVGTIALLVPLASGMQGHLESLMPIMLAAIVGGAMFGDNLSFISDTTIAATRTQNVSMRSKFKVNIKIVAIPAILTFILYLFVPSPDYVAETLDFSWRQVLQMTPYILLFVLALSGMHVLKSLGAALLYTLFIGFAFNFFSPLKALEAFQVGLQSMLEISVLCLIIGGVVGLIRYHGGIDYIIDFISKRLKTKRQASLGIGALTALVNASVANNTIAILITGPLAKDIADEHEVKPEHTASIMDTTSCFIQGMIPYGAQILTAVGLYGAAISPLLIIKYLFYPMLIGLATLIFIFRVSKA